MTKLRKPSSLVQSLAAIGFLMLAACSKSAPEIEPLAYTDHPPPSQFTLEDPSRLEKPVDRWVITPRAEYEITALKLISETSFRDNRAMALPLDVVLAWGPMLDTSVLNQFDITHSGRFFYWRTNKRFIDEKSVYSLAKNIANVHFSFSSDPIALRTLEDLAPGALVKLKGTLVDMTAMDGTDVIKTSMTRADTGAGACEVMELHEIEVLRD